MCPCRACAIDASTDSDIMITAFETIGDRVAMSELRCERATPVVEEGEAVDGVPEHVCFDEIENDLERRTAETLALYIFKGEVVGKYRVLGDGKLERVKP